MSSTIKPKSVKKGPALICFGGPEIKLNLKAEEDSPWFNHEIAVHAVNDASPQPVKISPKTYQVLGASGDERIIEPPSDGVERDLEISFKSVFTAPPYLLSLRVGHFLRKFGRIDFSSRFPRVGVPFKVNGKVLSTYTYKELEGVDVDSFVNDVFFETVQTDAAGVGSVEFTLISPGKHTIGLRVFNPIDDSVTTHSVDITAFDGDVWEEAKLSINGEVVPKNMPFFLRSGQPNELELEVPFLDYEELSLDRSGESLGEKMDPDYGDWIRGLSGIYRWKMSQAVARSGVLELAISSRDIEQPLELRGFMMSPDLTQEVKGLLLDGNAFDEDEVFVRDVARTITVDYRPNTPVRNYQLTLTPKLLAGLQAGDVTVVPVAGQAHTWTVKVSRRSGMLEFGLTGDGFTTPVTTSVAKAISSNLHDEMKVLLNGAPIPEMGVDLIGGENVALTLQYLNGDIVKNMDLALDVEREEGLEPGDISSEPQLRQFSKKHEWEVRVPDKKAKFKFKYYATNESVKLLTPENRIETKKEEVLFKVYDYVEGKYVSVDEFVMPYNTLQTAFYLTLETKDGVPVPGVNMHLLQKSADDRNNDFEFVFVTNTEKKFFVVGGNSIITEYLNPVCLTAISLPGQPYVEIPFRMLPP